MITPKFYFILLTHGLIASICSEELTYRGENSVSKAIKCPDNEGSTINIGDPDMYITTTELLQRFGYKAEEHTVKTDDGYILTMHRIPGAPGATPVFLQHCLGCSSFVWIVNGKNKSIALLLADKGYDVWFGNARGNTYSRCHEKLSTSDSQFWNFSWHEMGIYDLPAEITYVTKETHKDILYIGYSMGTTMFYVMAIERPDIASKVKAMFSLSPVVYMSSIESPFGVLSQYANISESVSKLTGGGGEVLSQNIFTKLSLSFVCNTISFLQNICIQAMFSFFGFSPEQFDYETLPLILSHLPAGTSQKTVTHYNQLVESGRFSHYDYGPEGNLKIYNSKEAPDYDLSKIQVPIAIFWSDNDYLTFAKDIQRFYDQIPKKILNYKVQDKNFNHIDFLWAKDVNTLLYSTLLSTMEKYK
ncbi:hypothetical protein QAD02_011564 [Eretmocerus hayati]|uniref:Uncharacterized protein n=1 Tax=Eretmocerus hayati TaxID=131215 RepID=A0ACC2NY35_9HYME|nr:hypothetical protein QAD02_011564 [Eretmocerus hayati]